MRRVVVGLASLAVLAAACTAGGTSSKVATVNPSISHAPVTLDLWTFFTAREFKESRSVVQAFEGKYPWITVNYTGGKDVDDNNNIKQAINSGTPPDVVISPFPQDVGRFCSTGGWIDLNPYIKQEHLDPASIIPRSALSYTSYQGVQCALPMLSDAYGLYYNIDMLNRAGYTEPPKTLSQLAETAKKLTQFNDDGSIKVAGWVPLLENFYENQAISFGHAYGAQWYDSSGKAALASDSRWAKMLAWQKSLVDWYGYDKLLKFFAQLGGPDSEWSTAQGFEQGKIAMNTDGEWRVAFIDADKANINYGTAPFPTADDETQLYGSGQIGGNTVGIPKGAKHPAEAWLLLKYLATDTDALVSLANLLKNVPTTYAALKNPTLTNDPHFKTFLDIFANPNSAYKPLTVVGDADQSLFANFIGRWQAGKVSDLESGLQQVAKQIDEQASLG
jgi:multiple sugar transport system substrate-binding protein